MEGKDDAVSFLHTLNSSVAFSECSCVLLGTVPALGAQRWQPQGPAPMEVNYTPCG